MAEDIENESGLVERLAGLAGIELDSAEKERLEGELVSIIDYVEVLEGFTGAEGVLDKEAYEGQNTGRNDEPEEGFSRKEAFRNAPETEGGFFKSPPTLERK